MSTSAAVMNRPNQYIHFSVGSGWAAKWTYTGAPLADEIATASVV